MTHSDDGAKSPLLDGYDRLVHVGNGGTAAVYSATRTSDGSPVAVKIFDAGESGAAARQIAAMQRLVEVPGILQILDEGTLPDGRRYLVTPFCPGGSLSQRMARFGGLPPAEVTQIGTVLARALAQAHAAGVLHRDIKPSNVLFGSDGVPVLSDFGAAKLSDSATASETMAVTVLYAAPEVLLGETTTERSDVYSLGLTLLAASLGSHPFRGEDGDSGSSSNRAIGSVISRICEEGIPDATELDLPHGIAAVLSCATALEPGDRYADAGRLRAALAAVSDAPDRIPDGTTTRRAIRRTTKRRRVVVAGVSAVALLIGVIIGAWVLLRDEPAAEARFGKAVTERNGILGPLHQQKYATYVGMLDPGCKEGQNLVQLSIHAGPNDMARGVDKPWDAVMGEGAGTFISYMPCDTGTDEARYLLGATGRWFVLVAEFNDDQYERMSGWARENENSDSPDWTVDDDIRKALQDPSIYRGWAIIDQKAE